ncbi:hypothetical protein GCM10011344_41450 [Dokdonia pacifica]|nr:hypothetical protein GCM10011344_41450 [Dokdonia pacifica]
MKIKKDTIYKLDVNNRIEYFNILSKIILPDYFDLKKKINNTIKAEDKIKVEKIIKSYNQKSIYYLNKFQETQRIRYQNTLAYNNLNTILIFETLSIYPDSYAILMNESILNSKINIKDKFLIDQLFSKYEYLLTDNEKTISKMQIQITKSKSQLKIVDIFQNTGNKTDKDIAKSKLIDLLIWSIK